MYNLISRSCCNNERIIIVPEPFSGLSCTEFCVKSQENNAKPRKGSHPLRHSCVITRGRVDLRGKGIFLDDLELKIDKWRARVVLVHPFGGVLSFFVRNLVKAELFRPAIYSESSGRINKARGRRQASTPCSGWSPFVSIQISFQNKRGIDVKKNMHEWCAEIFGRRKNF